MRLSLDHTDRWLFLLLAVTVLCLTFSRQEYIQHQKIAWSSIERTPLWLEQAIWGPAQGVGADIKMLDAMVHYYDAMHQAKNDPEAWQAISRLLFRVQELDPKFLDTYHLGIVVLAYDAGMPEKAVQLALLGAEQLPEDWQTPFTGGFVAYDKLRDYKKAFELMDMAAQRRNAPLLATMLAARFRMKKDSTDIVIAYLKQKMLTLPEEYRDGIRDRIKQLEQQKKFGPGE